MARASSRRAGPDRGVAIIAALLVVTLAAILVAGLAWREQVQVRRVESAQLGSATQAIGRGAVDYARLVLRSSADASPSVDYIGQVWSMPLQRTRLSDFLTQIGEARAEQGLSTYMSGGIEDAQSRYNLHNLAVTVAGPTGPVIDPLAVASYERLLATLGLPPDLAQGTAQYVRAGQSSIGGGAGSTGANEFGAAGSTAAAQAATAAAGGPSAGALPLPLSSLSGLLDVPGYTPAMIVRLAPFVTVLPVATPVNVNTAPAEVLVAVIPGLSLTAAQTVVAERTKAYFRDTGDLQTLLAASGVSLPSGNTLSVRSQFFIVHADIQHERAEMHRDTLIYRAGPNPNSTRIISAQDIY